MKKIVIIANLGPNDWTSNEPTNTKDVPFENLPYPNVTCERIQASILIRSIFGTCRDIVELQVYLLRPLVFFRNKAWFFRHKPVLKESPSLITRGAISKEGGSMGHLLLEVAGCYATRPYPYHPWDWYIYLHGWLKSYRKLYHTWMLYGIPLPEYALPSAHRRRSIERFGRRRTRDAPLFQGEVMRSTWALKKTWARWWFQILYLLCSPLFGEGFQFDYYFSDGLKPPTSRVYIGDYTTQLCGDFNSPL